MLSLLGGLELRIGGEDMKYPGISRAKREIGRHDNVSVKDHVSYKIMFQDAKRFTVHLHLVMIQTWQIETSLSGGLKD